MVVRIWRGRVPREKADVYAKFLAERAVPDYRSVPGCLAVYVLRRDLEEAVEFTTLTLWRDLEAIRAFAGEEYERAKYYPEDRAFLLAFPPFVEHYQVVAKAP